jgi:hypothetical protein
MFKLYAHEGIDHQVPIDSVVRIDHLWGYGDTGPSKMFTVKTTAKDGDTILSCLKKLAETYFDVCKIKGLEARSAYGYEGYTINADGDYDIFLGT